MGTKDCVFVHRVHGLMCLFIQQEREQLCSYNVFVTQSKPRWNNKRDDHCNMSGYILINWTWYKMVLIGYRAIPTYLTSYHSLYLPRTLARTLRIQEMKRFQSTNVHYQIKLSKKHVDKARLEDGKNNLFYPLICMVRKMQQGTSTV